MFVVQVNELSKKKLSYKCPICNIINYHGNEKNNLKNRTTYRILHCCNFDNVKLIINNKSIRKNLK